MKMRNSQPSFQFFCRSHCGWIASNIKLTLPQLLIIFISSAQTDISDFIACSSKHLNELTALLSELIVSNKIHLPDRGHSLMNQAIKLHPHFGVRSHLAFSHNGIHIAVCKIHVWKFLSESSIYIVQITAYEVVHTACIDQYGPRSLRHPV